ncbi:hypothetical protein PMSD_06855 [Paenibacillus macquariensis subsp. defensor]|nr:hypothetical protein PMSD_06855 [Paenibacillus macquariensis subsp. defensor]
MRIYYPNHVPSHLFSRNKLKKMSLRPISEHVGYVIYPPQHRRYKLYSLEDARPMDKHTGYSLLIEDTSVDARRRFHSFTKRFQDTNPFEN